LGLVTTWIGDCLLTDKPSVYVPNLPSLWNRQIEYQAVDWG